MPNLREELKLRLMGYEGRFLVVLDDKNRLTLPAALRRTQPRVKSRSKKMTDRFVLTRGFEGGLALYPASEWMRIQEKLSDVSFTQREFRYFNRILHSEAAEVVLDLQGRIPISKNHKELAGLSRDAVVIGAGRWIEIWNPRRYKKYLAEFGMSWEESAEKLFPGS
jgi:MraZ protein